MQQIYSKILYDRQSVIIFDEVQTCPKARQAIKYLVQDGRYDYIETGSLISIKKNTEGITIPSEEDRIQMYPMDYEEFRWALGDTATFPLLQIFWDKKMPLGAAHREAQKNLVCGLDGIKQLFGCSTTTAWRIKSSEWICPAISQVGRKIVVDADLALELANENTQRVTYRK